MALRVASRQAEGPFRFGKNAFEMGGAHLMM
jgi:hypothetical protein